MKISGFPRKRHGVEKMTMKLRLFTHWAADKMEETLLKKDSLGYAPWETGSHSQRYKKLMEEWDEVEEAVSDCCIEEKRTQEALDHLKLELVDLALSAMMMAGGFDDKISQLERGRIK
jgi:NTP pyrophosphatase (non-canonical NTP hydrolase)